MSLRICLDRKALADLLKDASDKQILNLRQQVIDSFVGKRLKSIVPDSVDKILTAEIKSRIAKEIGTVSGWSHPMVDLNPAFEERVKGKIEAKFKEIKEGLDASIHQLISLEVDKLRPFIEETITKRIEHEVEAEVKERVRARIKQAIGE